MEQETEVRARPPTVTWNDSSPSVLFRALVYVTGNLEDELQQITSDLDKRNLKIDTFRRQFQKIATMVTGMVTDLPRFHVGDLAIYPEPGYIPFNEQIDETTPDHQRNRVPFGLINLNEIKQEVEDPPETDCPSTDVARNDAPEGKPQPPGKRFTRAQAAGSLHKSYI